ncbi:unnamed protein product, partial [marine sediment metagenome]
SEETQLDYEMHMLDLGANLDNIVYSHEHDIPRSIENDKDCLMLYFQDTVLHANADIVFWDNITTSKIYTDFIATQNYVTIELDKFCKKNNITIFYVVHANKKLNSSVLIEGKDIRGSNQLYQRSAYFYIIQRFYKNGEWFAFVNIDKHRGPFEIKRKYHQLVFEKGMYTSDREVDFEAINEAFMERDYLGRKKSTKKGRYREQVERGGHLSEKDNGRFYN